MIRRSDAHLAMRSHALQTVVAETGTMTLTATTTGFTRADAGSFISDGFAPGMEVTPAGFTSNTVAMITAVTASAITIKGTRAAEASGAGRSLTVYLPAARAFSNERFEKPKQGNYLEEDFVPATNALKTLPADGGDVEETGLYVLRIFGYGPVGLLALHGYADGVREQFAPGTAITTTRGDVLRVRTDTSVIASEILPLDTGWSVVTVTVPWWARTVNAVAA